MGNLRLKVGVRNQMLNALRDALDAGAGAAVARIYSGSQPANADAALSGNTLLAEVVLNNPAAPDAADGDLILDNVPIPEDAAANAGGTASFARVVDSNGLVVFDCDVTETGGGGTIELNTVTIVIGGLVKVTYFIISIAAS